jgi:hypothetical protein
MYCANYAGMIGFVQMIENNWMKSMSLLNYNFNFVIFVSDIIGYLIEYQNEDSMPFFYVNHVLFLRVLSSVNISVIEQTSLVLLVTLCLICIRCPTFIVRK